MKGRDVFDLLLALVAITAAYVQLYGLGDPATTLEEVATVLLDLDVRFYLVLAGVGGVIFVAYLVVYLPRRDTNRSPRQS
jgi:hypothetical protein